MGNDLLIYGGLSIIAIAIASSQGDRQTLSHQSQATATATVSGKIESEYRERQKELAQSRYQSGLCLIANQPIAPDLAVRGSIPNGSIICDRVGMTAIADRKGHLTQLAKTDNRTIINEGLKE